jgi:methylthioribulose-1-phosphate dehydratase
MNATVIDVALDGLDDVLRARAAELVNAGRRLYQRGWVPATSGNFSARLDGRRIAITVSGAHKGELDVQHIMVVDTQGRALQDKRPSAETLLHSMLYARFPEVGAVLHVHSVNATLLSRMVSGALVLEGYELLKALRGIETHDTAVRLPIFANDQHIPRLAAAVERALDQDHSFPAYLIAGHGLYAWGESVEETMRYLEALDFLFDCELRMHGVGNR